MLYGGKSVVNSAISELTTVATKAPLIRRCYLRTFINREIGKVVVIRFKPSKSVKSYDHALVFDGCAAEMRFWSISLSASQATTRAMDGVFEEEISGRSGRFSNFRSEQRKEPSNVRNFRTRRG